MLMNRLVLATLLLLPFNALPIYFFGSISSEGAFYPLLGLIMLVSILTIKNGRFIVFDRTIMGIMFFILVFSLVTFVFNYSSIKGASYMGRYGLIRYVEQFFQLLLGFLVAYSIAYSIKSDKHLFNIIKFSVIVMSLVILFGFFQAFAYYIGSIFYSVHSYIGSLLFHEGIPERMSAMGRIHSVSQEPSLLSMYVAVVCPYIIGYAVKTKRLYHIFFMMVILGLSFSRTGYVVFFLLSFLMFMMFRFGYLNISKFIYAIPVLFLLITLVLFTPLLHVFLSLLDVGDNGSNAARYAAVFSAVSLWLDNNIWFGVGLGQTGFHSAEYLPTWGFISAEIQDVANGERWPFIHNLLIKILVENGIVGICIWIALFSTVLLKLNRINRKNYKVKDPNAWIGHSAFASIVACILIMFNRELLSNMNIWVSLGLALAYIKLRNKNNLLEGNNRS